MESLENGKGLSEIAMRVYQRIVRSIQDATSPQLALEDIEEAVYIKATDGQIVLSNPSYDANFAGNLTAIGRYAKTYLDNSIWTVANASDQLIVHGCPFVDFEHVGLNGRGENLKMRTYKKSLLGVGHPKMAILGVTRIDGVLEDVQSERIQSLSAAWSHFEKLDLRDQHIAKGISHGMKVKALAQELDVSEKTVENRRQVIYKTLSISGPTDLVRILVRLQDNGFSDFGL